MAHLRPRKKTSCCLLPLFFLLVFRSARVFTQSLLAAALSAALPAAGHRAPAGPLGGPATARGPLRGAGSRSGTRSCRRCGRPGPRAALFVLLFFFCFFSLTPFNRLVFCSPGAPRFSAAPRKPGGGDCTQWDTCSHTLLTRRGLGRLLVPEHRAPLPVQHADAGAVPPQEGAQARAFPPSSPRDVRVHLRVPHCSLACENSCGREAASLVDRPKRAERRPRETRVSHARRQGLQVRRGRGFAERQRLRPVHLARASPAPCLRSISFLCVPLLCVFFFFFLGCLPLEAEERGEGRHEVAADVGEVREQHARPSVHEAGPGREELPLEALLHLNKPLAAAHLCFARF